MVGREKKTEIYGVQKSGARICRIKLSAIRTEIKSPGFSYSSSRADGTLNIAPPKTASSILFFKTNTPRARARYANVGDKRNLSGYFARIPAPNQVERDTSSLGTRAADVH